LAVDPAVTARRRRELTREELGRLRDTLAPDATDVSAAPLLGGVDTATYALRLAGVGGVKEYVVRVFRDQEGDPSAIARRDYAALTAVAGAITMAPRPIHLDAAGDLIGEPLLVMTRLPGRPLPPTDPADSWMRQMADALASVHDTPLDRLPADIRRDESAAERLARMLSRRPEQSDPLWDAVAFPDSVGRLRANPPTLVHGDFWFGNTTWESDRLTGIVDWDGARIGDPARDVAVARNDLAIFIGPAAADVFLDCYERARGPLADLAYWDVHVSLAPIKWLAHWVAGYQELGVDLQLPTARARLEAWVRRALDRL
jgi:aminoglycoside phosphotransferase (APT) family kinase protein